MHKYVISTNARDEPAIAEFVLYHLLVGFDFVFVIDHRSAIPIADELEKRLPVEFLRKTRVVRQDTDGGGKMAWISEHVVPFVRSSCSGYYIHLDADEFFKLRKDFDTVDDMMQSMGSPDILTLHWRLFGSSGLRSNPSGRVIPTYTRCSQSLDQHFKSMVSRRVFTDPRYAVVHPHWCYGPFKHVNLVGVGRFGNELPRDAGAIMRIFADGRRPQDAEACIHHYAIQSLEDLERRKVNRPRDDTLGYREVDVRDSVLQFNDESCTDLADFYDRRMKQILLCS